jgi:hypothetical protein
VSFYEGVLGLDLDEIALANMAWCSEMRDNYPTWMLRECFHQHTQHLVRVLQPDVILLSGSKLEVFQTPLALACPAAQIVLTPHFAHREGREFEEGRGRLIREELLAIRSKAFERRRKK